MSRLFDGMASTQPPEQGDAGQAGGQSARLVPTDRANRRVADTKVVKGEPLQPVPGHPYREQLPGPHGCRPSQDGEHDDEDRSADQMVGGDQLVHPHSPSTPTCVTVHSRALPAGATG